MQYEITGGIEKGIHYTRIVEKMDGEESQSQGMQTSKGMVKSHGTETEKLDTE